MNIFKLLDPSAYVNYTEDYTSLPLSTWYYYSTTKTSTSANGFDKDGKASLVMPGVKKEDLNISVVGDVLTISATSKHMYDGKPFTLSLPFPSLGRKSFDSDADTVQARLEDGVLHLQLKALVDEPAKSKKVKVL